MAWNETAWQAHVRLAEQSERYCSLSRNPLRFYWLRDGRVMAMHEDTGEVRRVLFWNSRSESRLLYGADPNEGLRWVLWKNALKTPAILKAHGC